MCLFNKSPSTLNMTVSLKSIADEAFVDLNNNGNYQYTELWDNEISVTNDKITADVRLTVLRFTESNLFDTILFN